MHRPKSRVLGEDVEVAVGVKDRGVDAKSHRRDHAVGQRPHRRPRPATPPVQGGGLLVVTESLDGNEVAAGQHAPKCFDVAVVATAGEYLHDDDLGSQQRSVILDELSERVMGRASGRPEELDPGGRVDEGQDTRPALLLS